MEPLRFLHIPKTAGTTFISILKRRYFAKKSFEFSGDIENDIIRYERLSENYKKNIELFIGHAPIITGIDKADNAAIVTFLREPVNRVKSFCQHVMEGKSPHLIKYFPPDKFNLDEFLESGNEELTNLQTKMLINSGDGALPNLLNNLSEDIAVKTAIDNLFNRISFFGLQEYFDESLILMSESLNWPMLVYASKNKRNIKKKLSFEKHHIEKIKQLNKLDLEVYKGAKEYFQHLLYSLPNREVKLKHLFRMNKANRLNIQIEDRIIELSKFIRDKNAKTNKKRELKEFLKSAK